MSKSELERFVGDVAKNEKLRDEVVANVTDNEKLAGFARSKGYDVSDEEMAAHIAERRAKLSEEDLDKVAGGAGAVAAEVAQTTQNLQVQGIVEAYMIATVVSTAT